MVSTLTEKFGLDINVFLEPVMTSEDDVGITSIAYFPDGQRMISGSWEKTTREWDLQSGKEIEEAQGVCEEAIRAVAVSSDGRWVVTAGGNHTTGELKACEVETGTMKTFKGHSSMINCIDVSTDSKLLASGSLDFTARIWNLVTGKLVAGPFKSVDFVGAVRFSTDSKKLAINSDSGKCLEVWDIQNQKLDVRIGKSTEGFPFAPGTYAPVFWTNKNKNILAAFSFTDDDASTIYEFDASTLETVGTPFEGHTEVITSLALLFDGALLASASDDNTIKLWAFESRQLLASFDVDDVEFLMPSPDSLQLAFTICDDPNIYMCNATSALLAIPEIQSALHKTDITLQHLLESDATRRPTIVRRTPAKSPAISFPPRHQRPSHAIDHQKPTFSRHVRKLFHFASRTTPVRHSQPRDPWDVPATLPLPPNLSSSTQAATQFEHFEISSPLRRSNRITQFLRQGLSFHSSGSLHEPQDVEVAAGRKVKHLVAANLPEYRKVDDTRHPSRQQTAVPQDDPSSDSSDVDSLPDVHWFKAFFCYYSCWSHGRLRAPPRWRLERVDIPRQDGATSSNRNVAHDHS